MEGQVQHLFTAFSTGFGFGFGFECKASKKACASLCSKQVFLNVTKQYVPRFSKRQDRRFTDLIPKRAP